METETLRLISLFLALLTFSVGLLCVGVGLQHPWLINFLSRILGQREKYAEEKNYIRALMIVPMLIWTLVFFMDGIGHPIDTEPARWLGRLGITIITVQIAVLCLNGRLIRFFSEKLDNREKK